MAGEPGGQEENSQPEVTGVGGASEEPIVCVLSKGVAVMACEAGRRQSNAKVGVKVK